MNLSNRADQFQKDNHITNEDLIPPASTFAYALLDKTGNVTFDPNRSTGDGLTLPRLARFTFDPSGNANQRTIGAHALNVQLPTKAIVLGAFFDVVTTFTSATDAATVALHLQSAGDVLAAIAISDTTNVLDAGLHAGKLGMPSFGADAAHDTQPEVAALFAASYLKLTAARTITATVAVEALTAGKLVGFVQYVIGG